MRVSWFDRVLIGLSGLLLVSIGTAAILAAANVIDFVGTFTIDLLIGDSTQMMVVLCAVSGLVILWGIRLCLFALRDLRRA